MILYRLPAVVLLLHLAAVPRPYPVVVVVVCGLLDRVCPCWAPMGHARHDQKKATTKILTQRTGRCLCRMFHLSRLIMADEQSAADDCSKNRQQGVSQRHIHKKTQQSKQLITPFRLHSTAFVLLPR